MEYLNNDDPTSYARPDFHKISHINFSLDVDFKRRVLTGSVSLSVERIKETDDLILDISRLVILNVSLISGEDLDYTIGDHINEIGSKLTIHLPDSGGPRPRSRLSRSSFEVYIEYETSPEASGLQWLDPPQTAGRKHPYLFSQCQGIHARSIFPCQDTSSVKFTYTAKVTAPSEFTVLMSAMRKGSATGPNGEGKRHFFSQPVPIPSYLLALCVGMLESRILGPRSTIWSEKEIIEESAWEFANADKMLVAAEKMCGPYQWGIYDVLVLPPSCPYGGMENACLTFVTPTCLAGDRSLEDVIVHEILHSWTGNLVTCSNLEHLWLNEGFTVFLERKLSALLRGESAHDSRYRDFLSILGLAELRDSVFVHQGVDNPLTKLVVDLKGLNPDDSYSVVPYEKGSVFLQYLENLLGGPDIFEPFLRAYINHFQRQSIKTEDFKEFLLQYFKDNANIKEIDWNGWLYTPGMPLHIPKYDSTMSDACTNLANDWTSANGDYSTFSNSDIKNLDSQQQRQFVAELLDKDNVSLEMVKAMEETYKMDSIRNSEVKYRWLRLCIKARWADKVKDALDYVNAQGRMKFVRPIYRDLYAWEAVRNQAIENFHENKKYMTHILEYTVKKDLNLDN